MIFDKLKLLLAVLIVAIGVGGFYYFDDQSDLVRIPGLLLACALAVVVGLQTAPGRGFQEFAKGSLRELRQVVWPTRKETTQVTLVVVALVIAVALFLWVVDLGLQKAVRLLIGRGS
ncbi:MAG: preprotein translocase subunit SecE [Acidiferrobacterales bacterium]